MKDEPKGMNEIHQSWEGSSEVDVLNKTSWPKLSKFIMAEYTQILQSLILRYTGLFVASYESQPVFFADLYVNCINSSFRRRLGVTEPRPVKFHFTKKKFH